MKARNELMSRSIDALKAGQSRAVNIKILSKILLLFEKRYRMHLITMLRESSLAVCMNSDTLFSEPIFPQRIESWWQTGWKKTME